MSESVGLDIGASAIKAVRYRRSLAGQDEVEYFYQPLPFLQPDQRDMAERARLIRRFLERHQLHRAPIVTALPCRNLSLRRLALPFTDPEKMAQVVPFEMENLIPMSIEDVAVEGLMLATKDVTPGTRPQSDVLVAAAPKKTLSEHLEFLGAARVHPAAVNVDALALFSVVQLLRSEGGAVPENLAVLDVGATKTTICLIHRDRPWLLRTLSWGGNHLTQALAQRYQWTLEEAERRKRMATVQLGEEWIEPLVREVRLALHAFESSTQTRIQHLWVSGGGAKFRHFPEYLGQKLELDVVGPREGFGQTSPRAFSVALGLALHPKVLGRRWLAKSNGAALGYDLKRQLHEGQRVRSQEIKQDTIWASVGLACLIALGIGDVWTHVSLKRDQVRQDRAALQAFYQRAIGGDALPGEEVDRARSQVVSLSKRIELLESQQTPVIPTLAKLVRRLPSSGTVRVRGLLMEGPGVQLEAETDSFDSVERIKKSLQQETGFQEIAVSDARVGASPNQVIFRLTFTAEAR